MGLLVTIPEQSIPEKGFAAVMESVSKTVSSVDNLQRFKADAESSPIRYNSAHFYPHASALIYMEEFRLIPDSHTTYYYYNL